MKHLYLIPRAGLCNRLRSVAAARRICELMNSNLTVVWEWGEWSDLFQPLKGIEIVKQRKSLPDLHPIKTKLFKDGGEISNQQLDMCREVVVLETGHVFSAQGFDSVADDGIGQWLPKPSDTIEKRISELRLEMPSDLVGIHIRRTDHVKSIKESPDVLFEEEISGLIRDRYGIFLATDNSQTRNRFATLFPGSIFFLEHNRKLAKRWPVVERLAGDVEDDYLDLVMLSRCKWIVGSSGSTFSGVAMMMNSDVRSRYLKK